MRTMFHQQTVLINIFELICNWTFSFFSICLFTHLHQWELRFLFCNLGYNPILLHFVASLFPVLSTGSSLGWLLCYTPQKQDLVGFSVLFVLALLYFLALSNAPESSDISCPVLEFSQGILILFIGKWCQKPWPEI